MLRKIKVYGNLAKFLGQRTFEAAVSSPAEAVRFLLANFPALEAHMANQHYKIKTGRARLDLEDLHYPLGLEPIEIIPVLVGAGNVGGAIGKIVAGVALVAAAFFIPGAAAWLGPLATNLTVGVGTSLALGGVAQLISPVPQISGPGISPQMGASAAQNNPGDPRNSFSFSGIQNVARQGVPVPVIYGETIVGSIVISLGVSTDKL